MKTFIAKVSLRVHVVAIPEKLGKLTVLYIPPQEILLV